MLFAAMLISHAHAGPRVYLSGGAGCPLFTGGLSQIAAQLEARGDVASVGCNFSDALAHACSGDVLIGHSYGALHACEAGAALLARGIHVKVIGIEPLYTGARCDPRLHAINYYGHGWPMPGAQNVFIASSYGHIGFPADPRVQARVIAAVRR